MIVSNVTTPAGKSIYYTGETRSAEYDLDGNTEHDEGVDGRNGTGRRTVGTGDGMGRSIDDVCDAEGREHCRTSGTPHGEQITRKETIGSNKMHRSNTVWGGTDYFNHIQEYNNLKKK